MLEDGRWGTYGTRRLMGPATSGSVRDMWLQTPVSKWVTNPGNVGGVIDFGIRVIIVGNQGGSNNPSIYMGPCVSNIEPSVHCTIAPESIVLDHGVNDGSPSSTKADLSVSCNLDTTVIMTLASGGDTVEIGGGRARISTSHGALGRPFSMRRGPNVVQFTSRLEGVKPGVWEASSVLVVSMY